MAFPVRTAALAWVCLVHVTSASTEERASNSRAGSQKPSTSLARLLLAYNPAFPGSRGGRLGMEQNSSPWASYSRKQLGDGTPIMTAPHDVRREAELLKKKVFAGIFGAAMTLAHSQAAFAAKYPDLMEFGDDDNPGKQFWREQVFGNNPVSLALWIVVCLAAIRFELKYPAPRPWQNLEEDDRERRMLDKDLDEAEKREYWNSPEQQEKRKREEERDRKRWELASQPGMSMQKVMQQEKENETLARELETNTTLRRERDIYVENRRDTENEDPRDLAEFINEE